jgi:hypothetical protein
MTIHDVDLLPTRELTPVIARATGPVSPVSPISPATPISPADRADAPVRVPISWLALGDSPRLDGFNEEHVARLADVEAPLPPILVERRTMRVIDGWHRLLAAVRRGRESIEVEFFEGSGADAFLRSVEANVKHGFPLSQADRRAAAARIIASHPAMSDRAIAHVAGLGAKTVASIRRTTSDGAPQSGRRIGRDGRIRPLNSLEGRIRAAELFTARPDASLREVAREAGVSPATAGDVRKRMRRGELPVPTRPERPRPAPETAPVVPVLVVRKLVQDPSLRHKEEGRRLLRMLQQCAIGPDDWAGLVEAVPAHCADVVRQLALQYARTWSSFAQGLDDRTRMPAPRQAPQDTV